ncbi:GNAT family N-acetyltransferase [Gimesia panareensis]|uniref:Acetyltransferase YpeA n=1 Tax=Gimesia panareensis TaxID=2527978 RepID=A0A518AD00_9PLAN|nr:GNAT family N-acetyltransferase [Gimesia panareensis]QDT29532.1 Acetyltransferase YpeA [Gimesia panareensis]QDU52575.1 Acetyltransferase YpeA [Gimesia panareensis]
MKQTPADIHIRDARSDDAERVAVISEAAFAPLRSIYRPTGATIARQAERAQTGTRLVAEIDGEIAATVQYDQHSDHLHLIGLAVHPDYQRRGIAGCLLEEICQRAILLAQPAVVLVTIKETGNVPLFEKLGFRVTHEEVATWCVSETYPLLHDVKMERVVL